MRLVTKEESDTKKLTQKSEELNLAYRTIDEKQVETDYLKRPTEMEEEHHGIEINKILLPDHTGPSPKARTTTTFFT